MQRPPDGAFAFAVQADSRLDENTVLGLYRNFLASALADRPDIHIDLGENLMTGKHPDRASAALQYAAQRHYLGLVGRSAPVFLLFGNQDCEEAFRPGAGGEAC